VQSEECRVQSEECTVKRAECRILTLKLDSGAFYALRLDRRSTIRSERVDLRSNRSHH